MHNNTPTHTPHTLTPHTPPYSPLTPLIHTLTPHTAAPILTTHNTSTLTPFIVDWLIFVS